MNIRNLLSLSLLLAATVGFAQDSAPSELKLDLLPNEVWWGGAVTLGTKMPYGVAPIDINLDGDNRGNQYAPLLVSSKVPALGAAPTRQRGRRRMALQGRAGFDERGRKLRGLGTGKREFCDLSAVESEALVPKRCPHASTLSSLVIAAFWKADLPKPKARNRAVQHAEKTVRISVCGLSLQLDDRRRLFENPSVRIEHEIVVRRDLGEGDRTRFAIALVEEHRELKPMQSALQL